MNNKSLKCIMVSFVAFMLVVGTPVSASTSTRVIKIQKDSKIMIVNGEEQPIEVPAQNVGGRFLVPLRSLGDALGCKVDWDANTSTATLTLGGTIVKVIKDSKIMLVNGKEQVLEVSARSVNGRFLVPLRAIGDAFGCEVVWNSVTSTALIIYDPEVIEQTISNVPTENPYSESKVAELFCQSTRSDDDMKYIMGFFKYQACINGGIDADYIEDEFIPGSRSYAALDGTIKVAQDKYNYAKSNLINLDDFCYSYLQELGHQIAFKVVHRDTNPTLFKFCVEQDDYISRKISGFKDKNAYSMFDEWYSLLYCDKVLMDFYGGNIKVQQLLSDEYELLKAGQNVNANMYFKGLFSDPKDNYKTRTPKIELYKRLMLEKLTELDLQSNPILGYLYGVKNGKAYIKPYDEIKEHAKLDLASSATLNEAKDILNIVYNLPATFGVDCPQLKEIQTTIDKMHNLEITRPWVKMPNEMVTIKQLSDQEVKNMYKEIMGYEFGTNK